MKKNILVTGGAGYIGSHILKQLLETTNYNIVVLDNLSTGLIDTIERLRLIRDFTFLEVDLQDFDQISMVLHKNKFDTIIHLAASIVVSESVLNPLKYYINNTVNTINLLKCAVEYNVGKFIFSSTAAVYGDIEDLPVHGIDENFQTVPVNPYGSSKLMSENIIQDIAKINQNFKFIIFRYFNVAGADINYENNVLSPRIGQTFPNATHLIKIASECATGTRNDMEIYGDDFNTNDGTCVRDYIHVDDIASAHVYAIEYLNENASNIFNVGSSKGYSVKEVISCMQKVSQHNFEVHMSSRRKGDVSSLISKNTKIKDMMKWIPKYDNLELICRSAYEWEKK